MYIYKFHLYISCNYNLKFLQRYYINVENSFFFALANRGLY